MSAFSIGLLIVIGVSAIGAIYMVVTTALMVRRDQKAQSEASAEAPVTPEAAT